MFQVKFGPVALNFGSDFWAPVFWFTNYNYNNNYFFWDTLSVFSPSVLRLPKIPLDRVKLGETKKGDLLPSSNAVVLPSASMV